MTGCESATVRVEDLNGSEHQCWLTKGDTMKSRGLLLLAFLALGCVLFSPESRSQANGFWLVTPEQAVQRDAPTVRGGDEFPSDGPVIEVKAPDLKQLQHAPVELNVAFSPKSAPVAIGTLQVTLVKLINIDITERLQEFISPTGIHIPEANLPSGKHRIQISIADTAGKVTVRELVIKVE